MAIMPIRAMRCFAGCLLWLVFASPGCREGPPSDTGGRIAPLPPAAPAPETRALLSPALAEKLVRLSLDCVDRDYPNKPGHVLETAAQVRPHREDTPAFFGCFDWHSAVHGHWAMARVLRLFPDIPCRAEIADRLDQHLRPDLLERERAFIEQPRARTFERPYGMGWLLRLRAELEMLSHPRAADWRRALDPLARAISRRLADYLKRLSVPVRDGTHQNTAFSLIHALDYACACNDPALADVVRRRARDFFLQDRACPTAFEPSGEDFISPCLAEADLMRRILTAKEYPSWLEAFLPPPQDERFRPLGAPVEVRDPQDPRIGHLIGLSFQRAASFDGIATALPPEHPWRAAYTTLAARHRAEALTQMFDAGYGGEHWLASFALLTLSPQEATACPQHQP